MMRCVCYFQRMANTNSTPMPPPPGSKQLRTVLVIALFLLTAAAVYLSWGALYDLALYVGGMADSRAALFPAVVDLVTIVAMLLALLSPGERSAPRVWAWITLCVFGVVTVAGNTAHVLTVDPQSLKLGELPAAVVNAVPAVALLMTTHLAAVSVFRRQPKALATARGRRTAAPPEAGETASPRSHPVATRPEKQRDVIRLRQAGHTLSEIERMTGIPKATAARWTKGIAAA